MKNPDLKQCIESKLKYYFEQLDGASSCGLYQMLVEDVEKTLFDFVLNYTNKNQSQAAKILGINRATLKKKIVFYKLKTKL